MQKIEGQMSKQTITEEIIQELVQEVNLAADSISKFIVILDHWKTAPAPDENEQELKMLLSKLKDLLAEDVFIEPEFIMQLEKQIPQGESMVKKYQELKHALEDFDYDKARTLLSELEQMTNV